MRVLRLNLYHTSLSRIRISREKGEKKKKERERDVCGFSKGMKAADDRVFNSGGKKGGRKGKGKKDLAPLEGKRGGGREKRQLRCFPVSANGRLGSWEEKEKKEG